MEAPEYIRDLAQIPERASAGACFGPPATAGDRTVIPVAEVVYGLGLGWGGGSDTADSGQDGGGGGAGGGGGGGGGSRVRGVAAIEISPDGVRVHPVRDETRIALAGIALASASTAIVARALTKLIRG